MPDLRTVLTETLAKHGVATLEHFHTGDVIECVCGWFYERETYAEHLADALLGLPGVAVTQLPDADHVQPGDEFENGRTDYALGDVSVFEDGEIHLFGAVWQLSDVKTLAAALLAAALSVEGNTNA